MPPFSEIKDYQERIISSVSEQHQDRLSELGIRKGTKIRYAINPNQPIIKIRNITYALSPSLLKYIEVD